MAGLPARSSSIPVCYAKVPMHVTEYLNSSTVSNAGRRSSVATEWNLTAGPDGNFSLLIRTLRASPTGKQHAS